MAKQYVAYKVCKYLVITYLFSILHVTYYNRIICHTNTVHDFPHLGTKVTAKVTRRICFVT